MRCSSNISVWQFDIHDFIHFIHKFIILNKSFYVILEFLTLSPAEWVVEDNNVWKQQGLKSESLPRISYLI